MLTDAQLRHFDQFVSAMHHLTVDFPTPCRYCSVHAVTEGAEALFCLVRAGVEPVPEGGELLDYGCVQLRRDCFDCGELPARLEELNKTQNLRLGNGWARFNLQNALPQQWFQKSRTPYHEWPGYLYQIGASGPPHLPQTPLVAVGLPPFVDAADAIRHWVGVPVSHSDSRIRHFLLFMPRFDARIERMQFSKGQLEVSCAARVSGLHLAVLAEDSERTFRGSVPVEPTVRFELMPSPTRLLVFVVDAKGEILDSFEEQEQWCSGERVIYAGAQYSRELMKLIRQGETDTVEFKEFIRTEDRKKAHEIVETVIAFANTAGGTVLFGVSDKAEIKGVGDHVPHDAEKAQTFSADYGRWIRDLLKQRLNRIPELEFTEERIGASTLFKLQAHEGSYKPYVDVLTNDTYVRRGANNVRPDPEAGLISMLGRGGIGF